MSGIRPPCLGRSMGRTRTGATAGINAGPAGFISAAACGAGAACDAGSGLGAGEEMAVEAATGIAATGEGCAAADRSAALNIPLRLSASIRSWNSAPGAAFRIELASEGARTPFFTSTFSKVATLASPVAADKLTLGLGLGFGLELGLGLAGAAALVVFAALSLAVFASLFAAIAGREAMGKIVRINSHFLGIDMDFAFNIEWGLLRSRIVAEHGSQSCVVFENDAMMPITNACDLRRNSTIAGHETL